MSEKVMLRSIDAEFPFDNKRRKKIFIERVLNLKEEYNEPVLSSLVIKKEEKKNKEVGIDYKTYIKSNGPIYF